MPKPNPIIDCIADLWFGGKVLRPHAARIGKLARDFKDLEATPEQIRERYRKMRKAWPNVAATPESLVKHWFEFAPPKKREASNGATQSVGEVLNNEQPVNENESRRLLFQQFAKMRKQA